MSFSGLVRAVSQSNDISGIQKGQVLGGVIVTTGVTLTFPLIASNVTNDQTTTVSGASLGDFVQVACTTALAAGLEVFGFVSAANTITVRMGNATAGSITPGALVFNILVLKP